MWGAIIPIALKIVEYFLAQRAMSNETKRKFYEFVEAMQGQNGSVKLSNSYREQLKRLAETAKPE